MFKPALTIVGSALLAGAALSPAVAAPLHQHHLDTPAPGTQDILVGQGLCTAADRGDQHDTAFHNFHGLVHLGGLRASGNLVITTTGC